MEPVIELGRCRPTWSVIFSAYVRADERMDVMSEEDMKGEEGGWFRDESRAKIVDVDGCSGCSGRW